MEIETLGLYDGLGEALGEDISVLGLALGDKDGDLLTLIDGEMLGE